MPDTALVDPPDQEIPTSGLKLSLDRLSDGAICNGSSGVFSTPEFANAVKDADLLLSYAASTGRLPDLAPEGVVRDLVSARQACEAGDVSASVAVAFWMAYSRLSSLTHPITAASIKACSKVSLRAAKAGAIILVMMIISFSIFLFMSNSIASDTAELIDQQNSAALKLWSDLQTLKATIAAQQAPGAAQVTLPAAMQGGAAAERVFEQTVEFARKNSLLLQSAGKLHSWFEFWEKEASPAVIALGEGNADGITNVRVSPDLSSPEQIKAEVVKQIEAYQSIRDYALALYKTNSIIYGGVTTYVLPAIYALLGAFLYGFRLYSRLIRRQEYLRSAAHSARYYIAAIAGLVVGLFGSLLPKSLALSPLAVAFLTGYAVEAFFSKLDDLIAKMRGNASVATASTQELGSD